MSKTLNFDLTEPQVRFRQSKAKYRAFVAGFGAGKSEMLITEAFIDAMTHPHALIALYAPTYDLIRLILWPRLLAKLSEHGIKYTANKTEKFIETEHPQCGNFILKSLEEPEKIVGYESFRAHIDEMDVLKEEQARMAWNKIIARNRQKLPVSDNMNRVSVYTTPEGFRFTYDRWVVKANDMYELVKAPSYSNPFLPDDYLESLRASYPSELIAAYIEGEFVNLTTGTVYKSFNRNTCNSKEIVIDNETIWVGVDFNVNKMAATIYVRRNKNTEWHGVDELSGLSDTPELISALKLKYPLNHIVVYPDSTGRNRKSIDASMSDIALLEQAKFEVRAHPKNPFVKDRVMAVNTAFCNKTLFINTDKCPVTTSCLEQQAYDDHGEPDKTTGKDHQNDAMGYPIAYEMPVRKPVANIPFSYIR